MSEAPTAQELWNNTVEFAKRNLLRMNGSATDDEINALARKVYAKMEFLVLPRPKQGRMKR